HKVREVCADSLKHVSVSAWLLPEHEAGDINLVVAIKHENEQIFWEGKSTSKMHLVAGKWQKLNAQFKIPADKIHADDDIYVYVWNKKGPTIFADDFEI